MTWIQKFQKQKEDLNDSFLLVKRLGLVDLISLEEKGATHRSIILFISPYTEKRV